VEAHDAVLAERVAAAADAWLRDPQDAQVYGRLVTATLAWRRGAPPLAVEELAAVDLPPRLGDALGSVLTELHRRTLDPGPGAAVPGDGAGVGS